MTDDLARLEASLNALAALYQFRRLDERIFRGLTVSQSYCLRQLFLHDARAMSELAANLGVQLSTMTGIVDQLEDKGLVERIDHPRDRRSLHVKLTSRGQKLYGSARESFLTHLAPLLEARRPAARRQILAFLDDLIPAIQRWRQEVPRR
jgi:DNA-binding MarR family transcriptional regulator